jgi:predicted Rossmann fold nucleotide-binding protein DprA/Smf involved in DNA uptake
MSATEDLRQSLQTRLVELEREASLVRNALQALDGSAPTSSITSASTTPAPKPRTTRTRRQTQPTEVVPAGKLEKLLAQTDGISTANLAKQADADPDQVLALLRELEKDGKVRRTGQRRGTRWHAVSGV